MRLAMQLCAILAWTLSSNRIQLEMMQRNLIQGNPVGEAKPKSLAKGYAFSVINVLLDVYGAILTKQNGVSLDTWQVCWVRFGSSSLMLLAIMLAARRCRVLSSPQNVKWATFPDIGKTGYAWISFGILSTTFICPALQNYAIFKIDLGIFSTLVSLTPIFSLPLCYIIKKERITVRAAIGTMAGCYSVCHRMKRLQYNDTLTVFYYCFKKYLVLLLSITMDQMSSQ